MVYTSNKLIDFKYLLDVLLITIIGFKEIMMIGIFDSGMGGLTVLKDAHELLPNEDFIYFGDSKNAPYGVKTKNEVIKLSDNICQMFIEKYNVKAIVIACNTATSAAVNILRKKYDIPIIGMEPAIKPAIVDNGGGKIIVMATEMTLKERKFNNLIKKFRDNNIIKVPCSELVDVIEDGNFEKKNLNRIIEECLNDIENIESIVLGCTHFIFIKNLLNKKFKNKIKIFDGNIGTIKNLKRILIKNETITNTNDIGTVLIENSGEIEILNKSKEIFKNYVKE